MQNVLVITDQLDIFKQISQSLGTDYRVEHSRTLHDALPSLHDSRYEIVFGQQDYFVDTDRSIDPEPIESIAGIYPPVHIIVITPRDRIRQSVQLIKKGASDYIVSPVNSEEVRLVAKAVREATIQKLELNYLRDRFWRSESLSVIQTGSPLMQKVYEQVRSVAPTKATVLLIGETGIGKSFLARLIHQHSNRREAQFISVHCGAIPDTLLESELFGHEKGSFTGAHRKKLGKFEIAKGGTIFLDEIATLTPAAQIKLLQILQEKTFSRVGGEEVIKADTRIITATNADLKGMSNGGQFRKDLYYRLNVFPIELPPLRQRPEDISVLVKHFLQQLNREHGKQIDGVHPRVLSALKHYHWPGNIRELENLMERAYILEGTTNLTPEGFPEDLFGGEAMSAVLSVDSQTTLAEARKAAVEDCERQYLKDLFIRNRGRVNKSAEEAGITTRQLNKLMHKYEIRKEEYKNKT